MNPSFFVRRFIKSIAGIISIIFLAREKLFTIEHKINANKKKDKIQLTGRFNVLLSVLDCWCPSVDKFFKSSIL